MVFIVLSLISILWIIYLHLFIITDVDIKSETKIETETKTKSEIGTDEIVNTKVEMFDIIPFKSKQYNYLFM